MDLEHFCYVGVSLDPAIPFHVRLQPLLDCAATCHSVASALIPQGCSRCESESSSLLDGQYAFYQRLPPLLVDLHYGAEYSFGRQVSHCSLLDIVKLKFRCRGQADCKGTFHGNFQILSMIWEAEPEEFPLQGAFRSGSNCWPIDFMPPHNLEMRMPSHLCRGPSNGGYSKRILVCLSCEQYPHTCSRHSSKDECFKARCADQWSDLHDSKSQSQELFRILQKYGFTLLARPDLQKSDLAAVYEELKSQISEEGPCFIWLHCGIHGVSMGGYSLLAPSDNVKGSLTNLIPLEEIQTKIAPPSERDLLVTTYDACRERLAFQESAELQGMRVHLDQCTRDWGSTLCQKLQLNACKAGHAATGDVTKVLCRGLEHLPQLPLPLVFRKVRDNVIHVYRGKFLRQDPRYNKPLQQPEVLDEQCESAPCLSSLRVSP